MAEISRKINAVLAARRKKVSDDLEERKSEAYEKIPGLSGLDEEITLSGIRFARKLVRGEPGENKPDELYRHIENLKTKRQYLLTANGYPADYLEPRYICPVCRDTGMVSDTALSAAKLCNCYRQLYLENLYQVSNILDDGRTGFECFDDSFYSDAPDKKRYDSDVSPRAQILSIKEHCSAFIRHFENPETPNLYFFGSAGTGKTFMAKSVGLELLEKGYTVLYLSAPSLFDIIRKSRLNADAEDRGEDSSYRDLLTAQLLILDDLGTEPASDARSAEFITLLEARRARSAQHISKMIISTNLGIKLLYQLYNERIASRIAGEFDALKFFGEDIRALRKYKRV